MIEDFKHTSICTSGELDTAAYIIEKEMKYREVITQTKEWILSRDTIERLLPGVRREVTDIEASYPQRNLPDGAEVTRIAPSPTGFMHLGVLYASLISERIAHGSDGVFFLRIEDTDRKREIKGAREFIIDSLANFGIHTDEGVGKHETENGKYGPYTQSQRKEIYQSYIKKMLARGDAYPCFMTSDELEAMTKHQNKLRVRPGYHGSWAEWRDRPEADVLAALDRGMPFVIRYRSTGNIKKRRIIQDAARGKLEMPENDNDIVIMKHDGLPTYHLAHVIDDYLMHTTLVVRGDEWIPSTTLHMQLCETLGYKPFTYAHIAPLQKIEGNSRRKLSKRKDPEANIGYYTKQGYLPQVLIEYLLNQANSAYEGWRYSNPNTPNTEYKLSIGNLSKSGALFNLDKLDSISADYIATINAEELYSLIADWANKYDQIFYSAFTQDPQYSIAVLNIERGGDQPRKDMKHFSQAPDLYGYFFDEIYNQLTVEPSIQEQVDKIDLKVQQQLVNDLIENYDPADSNERWFAKLKQTAESLGFTSDRKKYRNSPELYEGLIADAAMVIRVGLTKRNKSPSLHEIMRAMGTERINKRLHLFVNNLT